MGFRNSIFGVKKSGGSKPSMSPRPSGNSLSNTLRPSTGNTSTDTTMKPSGKYGMGGGWRRRGAV